MDGSDAATVLATQLAQRLSQLLLAIMLVLLGALQPLTVRADELPVDMDLQRIQQDGSQLHEQAPRGVPRGYDWARGPRMGAGNNPGSFRAGTGWGQVFRQDDPVGSDPGALQIRDMRVLVCAGASREWQLVQQGRIDGRQFRADFSGNVAQPARRFEQGADGVATIAFATGTDFHFWPVQGRFDLPAGPLCGFMVMLEARLDPAGRGAGVADPSYLIGLGADYWLDRSAAWDSYRTNRDVAIGRLRLVGTDWRWYGLSTAADGDLQTLRIQGYAR